MEHLEPIQNVELAPKDTYILRDLNTNRDYICHRNKWFDFCRVFTRLTDAPRSFTFDLCQAVSHALFFEIGIQYFREDSNLFFQRLDLYLDRILTVDLKPQFFPKIEFFTCIVSFGVERNLYLQFPEIEIAHDDYLRLCSKLESLFRYEDEHISYSLRVSNRVVIVNSAHPDNFQNGIFRVYSVSENDVYFIRMHKECTFEKVKKEFKRLKQNMNHFFRKLFLFRHFVDVVQKTREWAMPVCPEPALYKLTYDVVIHSVADACTSDYEIVAQFKYRNNATLCIRKHRDFKLSGGRCWLQTYIYVTHSALLISDLDTDNAALKWWLYVSRNTVPVEDGIFRTVNLQLRQDNLAFADNPNPLKSILTFRDGYFVLPVFYALIRILDITSKDLIGNLRAMLDETTPSLLLLLNRLETIDDKVIHQIAKDFSINTVLFCGSNLYEQPRETKKIIERVIQSTKNLIVCATSGEQLVDILRRVQERHFPIVMVNVPQSCKKSTLLQWNAVNNYWQEAKNADVKNTVEGIWLEMVGVFKKANKLSDRTDVTKDVAIGLIVSAISHGTNLDRKMVEMDRHKWHLRVKSGVFDLLTGHVGGTVPEFYISGRQMGIDMKELPELYAREDLVRAYGLLVDKSFFLRYLKALFEDMTEDLHDTLREKFTEHGGSLNPLTESMLQFYAHFCKYTSFEYDLMMYLLDFAASLLVATNYARKFFILKGNTRNGKSKFFQMLSKVFGGYSYTVRSVNLQAGNVGLQAQPELASSLFCCRVITVEEMSGRINENMVKEITGNSTVSFRNLYEQNQGGIPTAKILASTNSNPSCTATEAFKDRIVAFPFDAVFTRDAPTLTSEQVETNRYKLETNDSVVEDSYRGFFALIYHHLIKTMHWDDGMIHYRAEPDRLIEYKDEFLLQTDIFSQFQQYMDIQVVPGCITTLQDLRSAIRQFLKNTHSVTWDENDIIIRFDVEYSHLKHLETDVNSFCPLPDDEFEYVASDGDDEESDYFSPPDRKRTKFEEKIVIYRNVQIKNLRKERRVLKKCHLMIDSLIDHIVMQNQNLRKYFDRNNIYAHMNNVTKQLVLDYEKSAVGHVHHVLNNSKDYGYLYNLVDDVHFNAVDFDYKTFPLLNFRFPVLSEIERIAGKFFPNYTLKFKATCLYLLYFYALLVNHDANWITMDYINHGNKYHQYFAAKYFNLKRIMYN